jgi:hypothetical protein
LMLDLMWHKVFTCMCRRMTTRSGDASTCLAEAGGWTDGRGSKAVARSLQRTQERESDGRRRRGMGSTPPRAVLFIWGSTKSIRCGSFYSTMFFNGSIARSSRED